MGYHFPKVSPVKLKRPKLTINNNFKQNSQFSPLFQRRGPSDFVLFGLGLCIYTRAQGRPSYGRIDDFDNWSNIKYSKLTATILRQLIGE